MNKLQKAKVILAKQEIKFVNKILSYFGRKQHPEEWYKYYKLQKRIVDKMELDEIEEAIEILRRT